VDLHLELRGPKLSVANYGRNFRTIYLALSFISFYQCSFAGYYRIFTDSLLIFTSMLCFLLEKFLDNTSSFDQLFQFLFFYCFIQKLTYYCLKRP
jgi:hypothetical protein